MRLLACAAAGLASLAWSSSPALADDGDARLEVKQTEVIWEWSPYYSSAGLHIPLTDAPQEIALGDMGEEEVYQRLFASTLDPTILLLEASVYPMPLLGTHLRKDSPQTYESDASHLRLIPALTAGFQEPWAVSAFIGNDMLFVRPGQPIKETNRGYMGYLLSFGKKHIADNRLIDDDWLEFEWKMKGERIFKEDRLSWSFRLGTRQHRNPDIKNTMYFGISRSSLDFEAPLLSWLQNTKVNLMTEFIRESGRFSRQEIIFGKKLPAKPGGWIAAWQIETGVIYQGQAKYGGALAETLNPGATFVLRPNIEF
jgi:hypothetical protein